MRNHLKNSLFGAVLLATCWLVMAALPVNHTHLAAANPAHRVSDPELTVIITSSSSVFLSWDSWAGSGDYTVTVTNLNSFQVEQSFTTSSTSASVTNLTAGHTYRFAVAKNGFVIVEDVIL